jgi:hypothetical protein
MGLENLYGFGCADFSPGSDWRRYRGFALHGLSVQQAACCIKLNAMRGAIFFRFSFNGLRG